MTAEINTRNLATLRPEVLPFLDKQTNTFSYIVKDPESNACAVIDSVLNFDYDSGTVSHEGANAIIDYISSNKLQLEWLIETHAHADHLFKDNEVYQIGNLTGLAIYTPGHTPACMTHLIGDAAFVGDTIFMPDAGTARADFPGGDARVLYRSIKKLLTLPKSTRLFMCHDYSEARELEYESTVEEQLKSNIHVNANVDEEGFVAMREARDKTLAVPHLILPSLQVNMRAGNFPEPEDNGMTYLKLPINAFAS